MVGPTSRIIGPIFGSRSVPKGFDMHALSHMKDDYSVRRVLNAVCSALPRNFVVMEARLASQRLTVASDVATLHHGRGVDWDRLL